MGCTKGVQGELSSCHSIAVAIHEVCWYICASILLESLLFLLEFTVRGTVHVASLGHHRSGGPVEVLFESRPISFDADREREKVVRCML